MPTEPLALKAILDGLRLLGLDVPKLGRAAGLSESDLQAPNHRIDDLRVARLWQKARAASGRETLPLEVGRTLPLGALGPIDYLAASSSTVGAAMLVTQQLFPVISPGIQLQIDRQPARTIISLINAPPIPGQSDSDLFTLAVLARRIDQLPARPVIPQLVELPVPAPPDRARWSGLLQGARLRFGSSITRLHLLDADWSVALRTADPRLLAVLRPMLAVPEGDADALLIAVRGVLRERLQDTPMLGQVARAVGLGERTLQRKLLGLGTRFGRLSDEVRRDAAEELVRSSGLPLGELARRLGFEEQASFTRAFVRWFGRTPSAARRAWASGHGS